ncbi:MAG: DUF2892 domain-containing protein [bacterium]
MKSINEAGWERILRAVAGVVFLYLGFSGVVTGVWGVVLIIIGIVMLITGLVGWCPVYAVLGTGTKKMEMEERVPTGGGDQPYFGEGPGEPEEPSGGSPEEPEREEPPSDERTPGSGGF